MIHSTASNATARNRLWIDDAGRIVCTEHGGYYLQSAIESSPESTHHITDLNDWEEISSSVYVPGLDCEVCEQVKVIVKGGLVALDGRIEEVGVCGII